MHHNIYAQTIIAALRNPQAAFSAPRTPQQPAADCERHPGVPALIYDNGQPWCAHCAVRRQMEHAQ